MRLPDQGLDPSIAVLMPVYRPDPHLLRLAVRSVLQQTCDYWQLVIVDDAGGSGEVDEVLAWAGRDTRVTVVALPENRGISAASNAGLEHVRAPLVALLDHDDLLEPKALAEVLAAAAAEPAAEVLYTDRDAVDVAGIPTETFIKPDWSPERLRGNMYIAHLTVLATPALREVGGFRSEFDGAQDHDVVLRITERGGPVVHIPKVLYHWRQTPHSTALDPGAKPYAAQRGVAAVQAHLDRVGLAGAVRHSPYPGFYLTSRTPRPVLASLVIPTRGGRGPVHGHDRVYAVAAVRSIVAHHYACDYEVVVVHDEAADRGYLTTLSELAGDRLRVVDFHGPFNFSAKINLGVEHARGEVVVLLNDDVEVLTPTWLDHLVALSQEPDVGAVGAKLFFEDGTIQHAGHFFGNGQVGHISQNRRRSSTGYFGSNVIDREVVGVTAAVLAQRREVWAHVGGFDETLPNNFNDVDYCLRIRAKGYRIVQANSVELYHFESRTRLARVRDWEAHRIQARIGDQLNRDPFTPEGTGEGSIVRSAREWVRVSRVVLQEEGARSFAEKARRRVARSRDPR